MKTKIRLPRHNESFQLTKPISLKTGPLCVDLLTGCTLSNFRGWISVGHDGKALIGFNSAKCTLSENEMQYFVEY